MTPTINAFLEAFRTIRSTGTDIKGIIVDKATFGKIVYEAGRIALVPMGANVGEITLDNVRIRETRS